MTFKKTCGRCERILKDNEDVYCQECEKFRLDIKTCICIVCGKSHEGTESLDLNYKGKCLECFYEEFNNYKTPQKVLNELEKFQKEYERKYGKKFK